MSQIVTFSFEEELKRNKELKESDIKYLREWNEKQPQLPTITDSSLALFLHSNYYRIEPTKVNIENYYTLRTHLPEFFSNRDTLSAKHLRKIFYVLYMLPLKQLTKEGYQILFVKFLDPDADKFVFNDYVKYFFMVIDLWVYQRGIRDGHVVVLDVQDISYQHAAQVNPFNVKKYIIYLQDGLPVRLKGLHFVNTTRGMEAILNISRPLMSKELLNILHTYPTVKGLTKFIPIELLPNELGGKAGQLKELHEAQIKELEEHQNWFLEEELRSQVDETKRMGKAKTATDIFGVEGSFKRLDVD